MKGVCYKPNIYDLSGDFGIGYFNDESTFLFDLEDFDKIKNSKWKKHHKGYVFDRYNQRMHRVVTNCPKGLEVDHINHDKTDNRKSNLRICTHQENLRNMKRVQKSSTGVTGVYKNGNKFVASIRHNYKDIYLGIYNTLEEAIKVRKEAEQKYFGEFAYNE